MDSTPSLTEHQVSRFISTSTITKIVPTLNSLVLCTDSYYGISPTPTSVSTATITVPPVNFTSSTTANADSQVNCSSKPDFIGEGDVYNMELMLNLSTTAFYGIIIILGITGNVLVIATLVRWPDMRSPCNFLLANIAAADFGVAIFLTPVRILELYYGWPLGKWGCHILFPIQDVLVSVSVVTHTAIALERHRAITRPFKLKLSRKKVKLIVTGIWLSCYALTGLPQSAFSRFVEWNGKFYCWPKWPDWPTSDHFRIGYELFLVVVFIVTPLLIQTFAYSRVIRIMKLKDEIHRIQSRSDSFETNSSMKHSYKNRIQKKRKLVRMLIVLMVSFQVCYVPRAVVMLLHEFVPSLEHSSAFNNIAKAVMILFYVKHVVNPIVLWFMSRDFHSGFLVMTTCRENQRR